jgi:hypothetical protein
LSGVTHAQLRRAGLDEVLAGARRRAGLAHAACHELRHTCLTWLREAGMALEAVQAQAGHASIESTRIYLHLVDDWLAAQYRKATDVGPPGSWVHLIPRRTRRGTRRAWPRSARPGSRASRAALGPGVEPGARDLEEPCHPETVWLLFSACISANASRSDQPSRNRRSCLSNNHWSKTPRTISFLRPIPRVDVFCWLHESRLVPTECWTQARAGAPFRWSSSQPLPTPGPRVAEVGRVGFPAIDHNVAKAALVYPQDTSHNRHPV